MTTQQARPISAIGLATVIAGVIPAMMDTFIVNIALPTIAKELGTSGTLLELVVAGYGIAFTLLLVLGGRLGDTFGRRRVLLTGILGFTLSSLCCALAPTPEALLSARIVQGAFAALIPPQALGTIQAATSGERRTRAISKYTAVTGISATLGQILGGLLLAADPAGTSWRSLFLINLPIGIALLVLIWRCVPETRAEHPKAIDAKGTVVFAAVLLSLLIPFSTGPLHDWPLWSIILLALAPPLGYLLWRTERAVTRSGKLALLPPELFRQPRVHRALLLYVPFLIGGGGFLFAFPLTMQTGLGLGPLAGGLALVPMSLTFYLASHAVPRLIRTLGYRILPLGVLVQACGLGLLTLTFLGDPQPAATIPGMTLIGLGQALAISGTNTHILAAVPSEFGGVGGGILVTIQQGAMALGTALLGTVYTATVPGDGFSIAFVTVLLIQIGIACLVVPSSRVLRS